MELLDEGEGWSYGIEIVNNKSRWARGGVQEYGYPSRGGEKRGKREDNRRGNQCNEGPQINETAARETLQQQQ